MLSDPTRAVSILVLGYILDDTENRNSEPVPFLSRGPPKKGTGQILLSHICVCIIYRPIIVRIIDRPIIVRMYLLLHACCACVAYARVLF